MQQLRNVFLRGLITFLPIAITIYILYAGVLIVENFLGGTIQSLFPNTYIPGLGFLITIAMIFLLGLMLNNLVIGGLLEQLENRLLGIPLIKAVYGPLRDLMNLFSKSGQRELKSVVMVDMGNGIRAMGLVTRDSFRDLEKLKPVIEDRVAVYVPWSYGVGGLTFLVPQSRLIPVDLPIDRALSLALTAWVKAHDDPEKKNG